jgi:hypothetical protein
MGDKGKYRQREGVCPHAAKKKKFSSPREEIKEMGRWVFINVMKTKNVFLNPVHIFK